MSTCIVFVTRNLGKRREIAAILERSLVRALFADGSDPEETGCTFFENAAIKARAAAHAERDHFPPDTLFAAEDSGLCVPALGGAPGVFSARYYAVPRDGLPPQSDVMKPSNVDHANNALLLERMRMLRASERSAYFETRLVVSDSSGEILWTTSGRAYGSILTSSMGSGGFGYDPLFVDSFGDCWGELAQQVKDTRSHRYQALSALVAAIGAS